MRCFIYNTELIRRDVRSGWEKRIEAMKKGLYHSIDVLKELEERTYNKKGLKERLVSRQKNRIDNIMNRIEEIEQRIEMI